MDYVNVGENDVTLQQKISVYLKNWIEVCG